MDRERYIHTTHHDSEVLIIHAVVIDGWLKQV